METLCSVQQVAPICFWTNLSHGHDLRLPLQQESEEELRAPEHRGLPRPGAEPFCVWCRTFWSCTTTTRCSVRWLRSRTRAPRSWPLVGMANIQYSMGTHEKNSSINFGKRHHNMSVLLRAMIWHIIFLHMDTTQVLFRIWNHEKRLGVILSHTHADLGIKLWHEWKVWAETIVEGPRSRLCPASSYWRALQWLKWLKKSLTTRKGWDC